MSEPGEDGLQRIPLLRDMPVPDRAALARACRWRRYGKGQHVFDREDTDDSVYFVVDGRVRVTIYTASGRQVTFRDLKAGETFGEIAAIDRGPRSSSVVSLDDALLASVAGPVFLAAVLREPAVATALLREMATMARRLTERVIDLSTLGVENRLHAELLRLAREAGIRDGRATLSPAPLQTDIAARISASREAVAREFGELTRAGVIDRERDALVIADIPCLEAMVEDVRRG